VGDLPKDGSPHADRNAGVLQILEPIYRFFTHLPIVSNFCFRAVEEMSAKY
jgi:hypothetical protein